MHICFLCNEYPPASHGGVGSVTQMLARALVARGERCSVVGLYEYVSIETEELDHGVRIIRLPHARLPLTNFFVGGRTLRAALTALHDRDPIDVLEGPETSLGVVPRTFPVAAVVRMHGGHRYFTITLGGKPKQWRSWQEGRSLNRADHLCAVSHFVAETTRRLAGLGDRPITVLPNPIDTAQFRPCATTPEKKDQLLFVGTITEKKGISHLLHAMPAILARYPEAQLDVVGRDTVDPVSRKSMIGRLRSQLPPDVAAKVHFRGPVARADLPEMVGQASICIFPSHMEALPMTWLEAMAMAKPVVASKTGPGPEVIEDGVSGLLCDPYSPSSIAAQVVRLLGDGALRRKLGAAARQRVLDKFSLDTLLDRNIEFYRKCSAENLCRTQ